MLSTFSDIKYLYTVTCQKKPYNHFNGSHIPDWKLKNPNFLSKVFKEVRGMSEFYCFEENM